MSGDRVDPAGGEGVTPCESREGQRDAAKKTVPAQRVEGVVAARGTITARARQERADGRLVAADQQHRQRDRRARYRRVLIGSRFACAER